MAWEYMKGMLQFGTIRACYRFFSLAELWPTNLFVVITLVVEWLQRSKSHAFSMEKNSFVVKYKIEWVLYYLVIVVVLFYVCNSTQQSFIYFQF